MLVRRAETAKGRAMVHAEHGQEESEDQKQAGRHKAARRSSSKPRDPFIRAENEDDDGYDPYSDRRPDPEPLFERDPWD